MLNAAFVLRQKVMFLHFEIITFFIIIKSDIQGVYKVQKTFKLFRRNVQLFIFLCFFLIKIVCNKKQSLAS